MMRPRTSCSLIFSVLFLAVAASVGAQGRVSRTVTAKEYCASAEEKRFAEDWYGAIEDYLAAVSKNPSYADALFGLAECYYELDEYDQSLAYVKRVSPLMRGDGALLNLEGFVDIGLGDLSAAKDLFNTVARTRPNDLDARFGLALLDLSVGRKTEARTRLEDSLRLSPQNARALLSLALIAADQGRKDEAESLIERALRFHGQEPRVQYTAARLAMRSGNLDKAIFYARNAIQASPSYGEARGLLGSLMYQSGSYAEAIALMQEGVARNRKDPDAWFTLGLAQAAAGKTPDAVYSLRQSLGLREDDEIARLALENLVVDTSPIESTAREPYATWHFEKGYDLEDRSFFEQALFEYRRGLALYPDSKRGRVLYADLLRKRGLPGKQLAELRFLADLGKADTAVKDSIETYESLLQDTVSRNWGVDQYALPKRPYQVAFFMLPEAEDGAHTSGRSILLRYLKDSLASSSRLKVLDLPVAVNSSAEAFRRAREAEADYYLVLTARENERDVLLRGDLKVARTGSLAASFNSYRTGNDRVKEATLKMAAYLESALQPKGSIIKRTQNRGLVDMGSLEGLKVGDKLGVIKRGELGILPEGLGPSYTSDALIGEFTVTALDEAVCEGTLKSTGFYDTTNAGDEIIVLEVPGTKGETSNHVAAPAEASGLFASVRRLR